MFDINFDITTREIIFSNNDFATTKNPSVQNGGILLYARGMNPVSPMLGVGILDVINGGMTRATFELNRWQAQAKTDGATIASWSGQPLNGSADILTEVSYL